MAREASAEVAYAPWSTFNTALDTLREHGLPTKLHRSVFKGQSGGTQAVLMASFKALGGINETNEVQPILHRLVDPAQRKAALQEIADTKYQAVLALGPTATMNEFDQVFRDYGLGGATHRKAKVFFLKLAEELGIKLSSYIMRGTTSTPTNGTVTPKTRTTRRRKTTVDDPTPPPSAKGSTKTIALTSGGEVTLTVTIDPMQLSDEDQEWVFGLIKQLRAYEKSGGPPSQAAADDGAAES